MLSLWRPSWRALGHRCARGADRRGPGFNDRRAVGTPGCALAPPRRWWRRQPLRPAALVRLLCSEFAVDLLARSRGVPSRAQGTWSPPGSRARRGRRARAGCAPRLPAPGLRWRRARRATRRRRRELGAVLLERHAGAGASRESLASSMTNSASVRSDTPKWLSSSCDTLLTSARCCSLSSSGPTWQAAAAAAAVVAARTAAGSTLPRVRPLALSAPRARASGSFPANPSLPSLPSPFLPSHTHAHTHAPALRAVAATRPPAAAACAAASLFTQGAAPAAGAPSKRTQNAANLNWRALKAFCLHVESTQQS